MASDPIFFYRASQDSQELSWTNDYNVIYVHACMQELLLWKRENLILYDRGVDYFAVFDGAAWLKDQVQNVTDKYSKYFAAITLGDPEEDGEYISMKIQFTLTDGSVVEKVLQV